MYPRYILWALQAAAYHERFMFSLEPFKLGKMNRYVFHVRAFFWELWSIWEYILQHANSQTLNLPPKEVRRGFLKKLKEIFPNYRFLKDLEQIQKEEYLKKIELVRDYAHKWQIPLSGFGAEGTNTVATIISLSLDNRDKDENLPKQVNIDRNDLLFIEKVVKALDDKGFFKGSEVYFGNPEDWRDR